MPFKHFKLMNLIPIDIVCFYEISPFRGGLSGVSMEILIVTIE